MACGNYIQQLINVVNDINYNLTDKMTQHRYMDVCDVNELSYETYYEELADKWQNVINSMVKHGNNCPQLPDIIKLYEMISRGSSFNKENPENIVLDYIIDKLLSSEDNNFSINRDFMKTLETFFYVLNNNCSCQLTDMAKHVFLKYKKIYSRRLVGQSKEGARQILKEDYKKLVNAISTFSENLSKGHDLKVPSGKSLDDYKGFSLESELNNLIPDSFGSLKQFFITVIVKYYSNMHPIIWAQIIKAILHNIFIDLPYTQDELYGFMARQILLNSGPFILKLLQLIHPILTEQMKAKYNLRDLKYPLMTPKQAELVLSKVVNDYKMYNILAHISASVGHVCIVYNSKRPNEKLVIKIIKPLSITQSCWEYKTLYNLFNKKEDYCEKNYIINMLKSNGEEMNITSEAQNITDAYKYYTASYKEIFGYDVNAKVTTVQLVNGVIKEGCWFALAETIAPGRQIKKLEEQQLLLHDTRYRAKLHRCLDLLVYKFFHTLVETGFYHGDLHAGNVFFSYEQNQITVIDWGAVGRFDIFKADSDIYNILEIIVMSIFYNYDDMFDKLTLMMNAKCGKDMIDMNAESYKQLRKIFTENKLINIRSFEQERKKRNEYKNDIFSDKRLKDERANEDKSSGYLMDYPNEQESIYQNLEYVQRGDESIIDNNDRLPVFTEITDNSKLMTFSGAILKITEYYASVGVNIATKFSEFSSFQKAYGLLLGVLSKVHYSSYRFGIVLNKAIVSWDHIGKITKLQTITHLVKTYFKEKEKYSALQNN